MTSCRQDSNSGIIFMPSRELNRNEMIGYVMATLHLLQYQQSVFKRRRPQGEATMRNVAPKMEHLPVKFVQLLTSLREKTNKSMPPSMSLPESFTAQPSVGKAKASHAAPPDPSAKAPPAEPESPTAASTDAPTPENEPSGTVCPKHAKGHVEKYRIMLDENINSEVVEHCVVDGHSYEHSSPKHAGRWMVLTSCDTLNEWIVTRQKSML